MTLVVSSSVGVDGTGTGTSLLEVSTAGGTEEEMEDGTAQVVQTSVTVTGGTDSEEEDSIGFSSEAVVITGGLDSVVEEVLTHSEHSSVTVTAGTCSDEVVETATEEVEQSSVTVTTAGELVEQSSVTVTIVPLTKEEETLERTTSGVEIGVEVVVVVSTHLWSAQDVIVTKTVEYWMAGAADTKAAIERAIDAVENFIVVYYMY